MTYFTRDEMNLMCIYDTGTREGLIEALTGMRGYLEPDEEELRSLTDSVLGKLRGMTDEEYGRLELVFDFDEDEPDGSKA